jgi:hypothetical protein
MLHHRTCDLALGHDRDAGPKPLEVINLGIRMGTSDDLQRRTDGAGLRDDLAGLERVWHGHEESSSLAEIGSPDQRRCRGIATKRLDAVVAESLDNILVVLNDEQWPTFAA